jgi:hypothetical protein
MRKLRIAPMLLIPGGLLAATLVASGYSVLHLVQTVALPTTSAESAASWRARPAAASRSEPMVAELNAALTSDPFRPERRPAPVPFRMPGEALSGNDADQPAPAQSIVLIGTAVSDGGGFAMCQIGSEPARLVRLGERLAGYTLRAVGQGRATFRSETGQTIEVRVARAGTS